MKFPGLITRGRGFKPPKKRKINWDWVMAAIAGAILAYLFFSALTVPSRYPYSVPEGEAFYMWKETSEGSDEWVRDYEAEQIMGIGDSPIPDGLIEWDGELLVTDEEGNLIPLVPLPPITLQQVYYDPETGKLWYIDDDRVPHEITIGIEVGEGE